MGRGQIKDMNGQTKGRWEVLYLDTSNPDRKAYWICKCTKCGTIKSVKGTRLRNGSSSSCGCLQKEITSKRMWRGYGGLPASVFSRIKGGCKRASRQIPFEITIEEAWAQFEKQDGKCLLSGVSIKFSDTHTGKSRNQQTASLDRIDSRLGYTVDNIQWVHKIINVMKQQLSDTEFIEWCKLVAASH